MRNAAQCSITRPAELFPRVGLNGAGDQVHQRSEVGLHAPAFGPPFADNFAAMQAESSNSDQWNSAANESAQAYSTAAADPVSRQPFADRFAEMQAISSKSDAWKFAPSEGEPAYATAGSTTVASPATTPAFVQRIARALNGRSGPAQ